MKGFRKIKIFKFADYASYEDCQESANDYYAEIVAYKIEAIVHFTVDFIAVTLPENKAISFKVKGEDIISCINKTSSTIRDTNTYLENGEESIANDKWK